MSLCVTFVLSGLTFPVIRHFYCHYRQYYLKLLISCLTVTLYDIIHTQLFFHQQEAGVELDDLRRLGHDMRSKLRQTARAVVAISGKDNTFLGNVALERDLAARNPYVDVLNVMQVCDVSIPTVVFIACPRS